MTLHYIVFRISMLNSKSDGAMEVTNIGSGVSDNLISLILDIFPLGEGEDL